MARVPEFLTEVQRKAYRAGWSACDRQTDYDVALPKWLRKNGSEHEDDWCDGYEDRAAGRERWHDSYCRRSGKMNDCNEH